MVVGLGLIDCVVEVNVEDFVTGFVSVLRVDIEVTVAQLFAGFWFALDLLDDVSVVACIGMITGDGSCGCCCICLSVMSIFLEVFVDISRMLPLIASIVSRFESESSTRLLGASGSNACFIRCCFLRLCFSVVIFDLPPTFTSTIPVLHVEGLGRVRAILFIILL